MKVRRTNAFDPASCIPPTSGTGAKPPPHRKEITCPCESLRATMATDLELLGRAVKHAPNKSFTPKPRWHCVAELLAIGGGSAIEMCRRFGHDPYEINYETFPCMDEER